MQCKQMELMKKVLIAAKSLRKKQPDGRQSSKSSTRHLNCIDVGVRAGSWASSVPQDCDLSSLKGSEKLSIKQNEKSKINVPTIHKTKGGGKGNGEADYMAAFVAQSDAVGRDIQRRNQIKSQSNKDTRHVCKQQFQ